MINIFILLLLSQEPLSPSWQYYFLNDFGAYTIGFGGSPTAWNDGVKSVSWNPAGLASIDKLSATCGFKYTDGEVSYPIFWDYKISEFLPYLAGFAFPLSKGVSLGVTFSIPYKMSHTSEWVEISLFEPPNDTVDYVRAVRSKRFYALNMGIGWKLGESFSFGLNLAGLIESYRSFTDYKYSDSLESEASSKQYGIEPTFGIQYEVNEAFILGALIKKGVVWGKLEWPEEDYSEREILPLIASFGIKINIVPKLTINNSIDYINWKGVSYYVNGEEVDIYNLKDVIRIHIGGEYKITSNIALRMGFYSDPYSSSSPTIQRDQLFLTAGLGLNLAKFKVNLAISSSRLLMPDDKEVTNYYLSLEY